MQYLLSFVNTKNRNFMQQKDNFLLINFVRLSHVTGTYLNCEYDEKYVHRENNVDIEESTLKTTSFVASS